MSQAFWQEAGELLVLAEHSRSPIRSNAVPQNEAILDKSWLN